MSGGDWSFGVILAFLFGILVLGAALEAVEIIWGACQPGG